MALLEVRDVSVNFGGVRALDAVSFDVDEGQLVGLIGPNGAGKTTLCQVISGSIAPARGGLRLAGAPVAGLPPFEMCRRGVGRTFQIVRPFLALSVLDNVAAAAMFSAARAPRIAECREQAVALLRRVGLADRARLRPAVLSLGEKKKLELARALATRPRLLLLDEVMAGLTAEETGELMALVREIHASGTAVVMVEHVVRVVMTLAERIVVLDHGEKIAEGAPRAVAADPGVIAAYLGARRAAAAARAPDGERR